MPKEITSFVSLFWNISAFADFCLDKSLWDLSLHSFEM